MLLKSLTRLRKKNVMFVALEQLSSHLVLEGLYLDTQGRLSNVQSLSRAIEAALLRNHDKIFELAQFHDRQIL